MIAPATQDKLSAVVLGASQKYGIPLARLNQASAQPDFTTSVLKAIGAPVNPNTTQALKDWVAAEGGPSDNPLNTTLGQGGAQGAGIKGYGSTQAGISATVNTLKNGLYQPVIAAFKSSNPTAVRQAVVNSPWDVSHYKGTSYRAALGQSAPQSPAVPSAPAGIARAGNGSQAPLPSELNLLPPIAPMSGASMIPMPTDPTAPTQTRGDALAAALLASGGRGVTANQLLRFSALPTSLPTATTGVAGTSAAGLPAAPAAGVGDPAAGSKPAPASAFAAMVSDANKIAGSKYNYEWGGGHNPGFAPASGLGHGSGAGVGYDCSGAISAILHAAGKLAQPMVASQFMSYGQPGPGGSGDITIYASPTHVFAEIGGRFFGTSMANPGGGAGWFGQAQTAGYTIRHVSLAGAPNLHLNAKGAVIPFRAT